MLLTSDLEPKPYGFGSLHHKIHCIEESRVRKWSFTNLWDNEVSQYVSNSQQDTDEAKDAWGMLIHLRFYFLLLTSLLLFLYTSCMLLCVLVIVVAIVSIRVSEIDCNWWWTQRDGEIRQWEKMEKSESDFEKWCVKLKWLGMWWCHTLILPQGFIYHLICISNNITSMVSS